MKNITAKQWAAVMVALGSSTSDCRMPADLNLPHLSAQMSKWDEAVSVAHNNWLDAIRTRPQEAEAWKAEHHRLASLSQEPDWTSKPTYSGWVHDHTGAETPIEQVGIYATLLGGVLYAGRSFVRSHHLMRAAQLPVGIEQRDIYQALGWLTDAEINNPAVVANRFRARGVFFGMGFPLLWLVYVRNKEK